MLSSHDEFFTMHGLAEYPERDYGCFQNGCLNMALYPFSQIDVLRYTVTDSMIQV
jgi:hypothetical protein